MIKSGYSFKVAVGHLPEVMSRIREVGLPAAPIADRCSTYSHVRWVKLAKENGVKPVLGVELAVSANIAASRPVVDYWTFLAKSSVRPLYDLVVAATSQQIREPTLRYSQALAAEGLIKIAGEAALVDHLDTSAPDLYLGLSPATPTGLHRAAVEKGVALVASYSNRYPRREDKEFYRIALGRRAHTQTYPMHVVSDAEWRRAVPLSVADDEASDALAAREEILDACDAELHPAVMLVPEKPATLMEMCVEGAGRLGVDLSDPVYAARLERELAMIREKAFEDYFYILADMVSWARQKMIVGPARGSSCGSLACFLLGITTVDPIKHDLIFERFIDVNRSDLPDIDVDFSEARRERVMEYVRDKYGVARVARLGSVSMHKVKSAMNQVGIALRIPSWDVEDVASKSIKRSMGDSRATATIEDTFSETETGRKFIAKWPEARIAVRLENHPANAGQHAAGVVITASDVTETVAVDARTGAAMCDKKDAESLNLLKIDALGLTQLTIFERVAQLIGKPQRGGWLEEIPLDCPEAFAVLNDRRFCGIFQFTGSAMRSVAEGVRFDCFDDVVAITALVRPGPLAAGGTNAWIERKMGKQQVVYHHPLIEPYVRDTLGVIIYQEQVMQIGREVGDLTWADVTDLRKAMSRSLGREYFDRYGDRWKEAAVGRGMPRDAADRLWDDMCGFGAWAFNKQHSVAYAYISYWCCWLKARYPVEFAAATLDSERDPSKQIEMLREIAREGIDYVPVDRNHSTARWEVKSEGNRKVLVGPLQNVVGIGPARVLEIIGARGRGEPLKASLEKLLEEARTPIDSLYPLRDRLTALYPGGLEEANIATAPTPISRVVPGYPGALVVVGVPVKLSKSDMNAQQKIAQRGGRVLSGPTMTLNMFMRDDEGEILCKIDRDLYEYLGTRVFEKTRIGKSIWALKGTMPRDFRMLRVSRAMYLGEIEDDLVSLAPRESEEE